MAKSNRTSSQEARDKALDARVAQIKHGLHPEVGQNPDLPDEERPAYLLRGTSTALLVLISQGHIDARESAILALAERGLDLDGHWVGFKTAETNALRRIAYLRSKKNNRRIAMGAKA